MTRTLLLFALILLGFGSRSQGLYFPPLTGSTWDTISPQGMGYCQPRIDSLYNYLQVKHTKSFILLKDGKIVLEKYFGTYTQDSLFYWASASKSLASVITGVAQQKGFIHINNPVSQYLDTGWTSEPLAKENLVTVRHLLTMTSGLDDAPPSCTNEDTAKACLIYKADAGTRWAYHTGAYRKVQDVVSQAVGQNYNIITNNWIEAQTGMSGFWFQQEYYSKARDMARFGLLSLNRGIWATDTVMKDTSYFHHMINTSQSFNLSYGYLWWLNGKPTYMNPGIQAVLAGPLVPNSPADMYAALGKNDQKIYVVPSTGMVVIRQGYSANGTTFALSTFDNTLWDYINKLNCSATGIEKENSPSFAIYPNPASSQVTISGADNLAAIRLYDLLGNLVYEQCVQSQAQHDVSLAALPSGAYIAELQTASGKVSRHKLIKD